MLKSRREILGQIVLKNEHWKNSVNQAVGSVVNNKFNKIFNKNQRFYILDQISTIDLDQLDTKIPENVKLS